MSLSYLASLQETPSSSYKCTHHLYEDKIRQIAHEECKLTHDEAEIEGNQYQYHSQMKEAQFHGIRDKYISITFAIKCNRRRKSSPRTLP